MKLFLNQRFKFTLGSQYHLLNKWSFPHLYKLHHISVSSFIFPFICSHMKYYITSYNTVLYYVSLVIWLFLSTCYVVSDSLQPHELQHARLPCPSPTPRACSDSCPSSWWCHPTISSSVINFSQHRGLFKWVSPSHQVAKVLELQLQHQSFQWLFKTDFL